MPFPSLFFCTTLLCLTHKMPVVRVHCAFFPKMKNLFHCTKAAVRQPPHGPLFLRCAAKRMEHTNTTQRANSCNAAERSRPARARIRRLQGCVIGAVSRVGGSCNYSVWKLFSFCNRWRGPTCGAALPPKNRHFLHLPPKFPPKRKDFVQSVHKTEIFLCISHLDKMK